MGEKIAKQSPRPHVLGFAASAPLAPSLRAPRLLADFFKIEEPNGRKNCEAISASKYSRLRRLRAPCAFLACPAVK
jgi:hypothetical protein